MKSIRITYLLLMIIVVIIGLLSRRISIIPAGVGDSLWAAMMFLMIRFIFPRKEVLHVALASLAVCFLVEISQLYHEAWIDDIRNTTIGALVLGRGFLWSDMLAYTIGVAICVTIEKTFRANK